jgi:DNA-binding IclR family transcriptional regulator
VDAGGRTVTSKVLAILAAFEASSTPLTLTQIAEAAQVPLPTAHRLVAELVEWGALERDDRGRYAVGMRLWEISQNAGRRLRDAARPLLNDLFSFTGETAHLAVREGSEALYVDRVYSAKRVPRASRVGGRLPLHATAVGKVLLAYEEQWVREGYVSSRLAAPTRRTKTNPKRLLEELEQIRLQGYGTTFEEARVGSCSIAVPVLAQPDRAVAAVGLVMLSTQANRMTRYLPQLSGTADRIADAVRRIPGPWVAGAGPARR